jgi:hypothetical protein
MPLLAMAVATYCSYGLQLSGNAFGVSRQRDRRTRSCYVSWTRVCDLILMFGMSFTLTADSKLRARSKTAFACLWPVESLDKLMALAYHMPR